MIYLFNCSASGTDAPCPFSGGACACTDAKAPDGRSRVLCARTDESVEEALRRHGVSAVGKLRLKRIQGGRQP